MGPRVKAKRSGQEKMRRKFLRMEFGCSSCEVCCSGISFLQLGLQVRVEVWLLFVGAVDEIEIIVFVQNCEKCDVRG